KAGIRQPEATQHAAAERQPLAGKLIEHRAEVIPRELASVRVETLAELNPLLMTRRRKRAEDFLWHIGPEQRDPALSRIQERSGPLHQLSHRLIAIEHLPGVDVPVTGESLIDDAPVSIDVVDTPRSASEVQAGIDR